MNTEYSDLITGCRTNGNEVLSRYPLVTVHSAHSNLAKIHSRLPVAMEFWLVCLGIVVCEQHLHVFILQGVLLRMD